MMRAEGTPTQSIIAGGRRSYVFDYEMAAG